MKLHQIALSFNSRRVRAIAAELDLPLEVVEVNFTQGEHKQPDFLAKNPNGRMPVLEDGDFYLWESHAIMNYLAALKPESELLPTDLKRRAVVDQWLFWQSSHFNVAISTVIFERVVKSLVGAGAPDEAKVAVALVDVNRGLAVLNDNLANKEYIAGPLSVVDFSVASTLTLNQMISLDLSPYPHVKAWLARIEARDSWKKSEPMMPA